MDKPSITAAASGAAVATNGLINKSQQSLLNSTLEQIYRGDFLWHGSDVATILGITFSVIGVLMAFAKQHKGNSDDCKSAD
ncbi:hypothetical protein [Pseudoalteromonas rubra]|uniref:hypothetical protein n=1 Tax=Pseudoalteromonas rubra TaxID=43658 RepID=UPI000F78ABC1|nr:hypothetical protein [Pseudoalteromonas rubra]